MVLADIAALAEGVAGKLAAIGQQIVSAAEFAGDAQRAHGGENHAQLAFEIVDVLAGDKGKVQIAAVVEDRAAAGNAPHQLHTVPLHGAQIAFRPGILAAADDDRVVIGIEVEEHIVGREVFDEILIRAQVVPAVRRRGNIELVCHNDLLYL